MYLLFPNLYYPEACTDLDGDDLETFYNKCLFPALSLAVPAPTVHRIPLPAQYARLFQMSPHNLGRLTKGSVKLAGTMTVSMFLDELFFHLDEHPRFQNALLFHVVTGE